MKILPESKDFPPQLMTFYSLWTNVSMKVRLYAIRFAFEQAPLPAAGMTEDLHYECREAVKSWFRPTVMLQCHLPVKKRC